MLYVDDKVLFLEIINSNQKTIRKWVPFIDKFDFENLILYSNDNSLVSQTKLGKRNYDNSISYLTKFHLLIETKNNFQNTLCNIPNGLRYYVPAEILLGEFLYLVLLEFEKNSYLETLLINLDIINKSDNFYFSLRHKFNGKIENFVLLELKLKRKSSNLIPDKHFSRILQFMEEIMNHLKAQFYNSNFITQEFVEQQSKFIEENILNQIKFHGSIDYSTVE